MPENGDGLDYLRIPFEKIKFGNKLEGHGYGSVFEGEFDDRRVALKQLNITNLGNIKPKLLAEILTISRFRQHPNLVALLGFCDERSNEIILVYEYVASGNLADKMRKRLTTIQRYEICLGAARGLDYLHTGVNSTTPGIVHGNIKLSKILLNSDSDSSKFEAKISSFGLSKIVPGQPQKTLESMEATEKSTKESDVYAFGVLLLEVLCGVSELVDTDDYQERHVTELVPKRLEQNKLRKIVHFDIRREIKTESLETYAKIACQCVMENPESRPTMAQVVEELEKALILQGGEVSNLQILRSESINGVPDGTVTDDGPKEDGDGVTVDSDKLEKEPEEAKVVMIEEDATEVISDVAGEDNGNQIGISSESTNGEENAEDDVTTHQDRSFDASTLDNVDNETSNVAITCTNDSNSIDESNINTNDSETIKELKEDSISKQESESQIPEEVKAGLESLRIPFKNIKFGNKIDIHGYGTMFEGEFNHQQVALKRLNITNLSNIKAKLLSEILNISRFQHHSNLVHLIGFCDENINEIIIVYEYIPDGNLADKMSKHLTTIQRLEISLGAARGLDYLHTGIVHGDIKLSKILLSSDLTTKVSGYGLSKLVPGQAQMSLDMDLADKTKESDVYSFGVLLLELLCGARELVDTDDYQERHVVELVPKKLEQNMLRKIVHIDIRDEIKTEALETYAKIACECVKENPEERPTMARVVEELEKALKLQGEGVVDVEVLGSNGNGVPKGNVVNDDLEMDYNGETMDKEINKIEEIIDGIAMGEGVTDVEVLGSNGNGVPEGNVVNDDSKMDYNGETMDKEFSKVEETIDDIAMGAQSSDVGESVPDITHAKDAKNENDKCTNEPETIEEIIAVAKPNEESKIIEENDSKMIHTFLKSNNGDVSHPAMDIGDVEEEKGNNNDITIKTDEHENKEEITNDKITPTDITTANNENDNTNKKQPEPIINTNTRDINPNDFTTSMELKYVGKTQEFGSERSNSTCSESSNGEDTAPSDSLLQKKTSSSSRNCCYCSWWSLFSSRVASCGGQFWNKSISCCTCIGGQFSRKHD